MLQEAYLDMDSLDRVKDTFLSNLSHEMRTPLTSILAAEEILTNFGDEDPDTRREFLQIIHLESTRLLDLIGKLLDLAKLEAKALQLNYTEVDLGELVGELVSVARGAARCAEGVVRIAADLPGTPLECECDSERVSRVVRSMLENAIRFSPPDGEVQVSMRQAGDMVTISVTDEASVSVDRFTDLFESVTAYAGAGADPADQRPLLGYPIAQKLATMHGGTLEHGTHGQGGTVVTLRLPVGVRESKSVPTPA
jgi:signal transduction histidine kinase